MTNPAAPGSATALACGGARSLSTFFNPFPAQAFTVTAWARGNGTFVGYALDEPTSFDATTTSLALRFDGLDLVVRLGQEEVHLPAAVQQRLADGEAHHFGVSLSHAPGANQADVQVYVDGFRVVQATVPMQNSQGGAMTLPDAGTFWLGATPPKYEGAGIDLFDGELTDVRVWTGELAAAAVYADFNRTVAGNEPALWAAWPLDGAHLDLARGAALDLGPGKRHIPWRTLIDRNPVFAQLDSFDAFPTADRCLQMWVRSGAGSAATLASYADVSGSDHPNDGGTPWQVLADRVPSDGRWHHLSVVGDSRAGTETTYVDGQVTGQRPVNYSGTLASQTLLLGAQRASDDDEQVFTGELRDVRLWSAVRSAEQIDLDARGATPPPTAADPACVAWWPLDAANGGTDASGRGNSLRIVNSAAWAAPTSLQAGGEPMAMGLAGVDDEGLTALPGITVGAGDFSAEVWLRTTRGGPVLLAQRQRDGEAQLTLAVGTDGIVELHTLAAAGSPAGSAALRAEGHTVNDDQWHHVALTCAHDDSDRAAATLWIDGETVTSGPCRAVFGEVPPAAAPGSTAAAFDAGPMLFSLAHEAGGHPGLQWPAGMPVFSGAVAEFRLWQRALVAGELRGGMHHRLRGDEPALAGRWGFERGSARDSSPNARHGVIAAGVTFSRDVVDLEPRDRPYLLVQTKLMEDYKFADPAGPAAAPQACTTYRVVVQAVAADGQAMADVKLTVGLHAEPAGPAEATLLAHGAQGTQAFTIGSGRTQDFVTNVEGRISFAVEAAVLTAPVLAVRAPFMDSGHELLVFPDRHAHAKLAQLSPQALLGQSAAGPGQRPRVLLGSAAQQASAEAVAHSVRKLMGAASESEPQSRNPVVRQRADRLVSPLPRTPSRRYENPYRSAAGYLPVSNLSAGHAVVPGQQVMRQVVSTGDHWMIERQADGSLSLLADDIDGSSGNGGTPAPSGAPPRSVRTVAEQLNPRFPDPVAALLVNAARKRSLVTRAELDAAFDDRRRGVFDFFQSIVDAAKVVFHAVEVALDTVGQVVKAVVCYVVNTAGEAVAAVVDTVHKAAEAVAGVFQKVGVAIGQVIDFVKDLFDWSDVVETQKVIEQHLSSVLPFVKTHLPSARAALLGGIAQWKAQVHTALQALEPARLQQGTRDAQSSQAYAQPADVRAGYVQQLVADHGSDARIDAPLAAPANLDSGALGALHQLGTTAPAGTRLSQRAGGFDPAPAHASALDALLLRLLRLLEEAADDAFDLAAQAVATLFDALAQVIDAMHALLAQRIDIPLLTTLYEKVVVPGSTLNGYSLAALVGAVPATLIYKLVNLSSDGPFRGIEPAPLSITWPFDDQGNPLRAAPPPPPAARTDTPTPSPTPAPTPIPAGPWREFICATWSLGGAFVGLLAVNGVLATVQRVKPRGGAHWRRFVLAAGWLFQCSQLPLDSFRRLNVGSNPRSAAAESVIWIGQFAPLVVDSIISIRQDAQVPNTQEGLFERIRGGAMSLFGVAHFVGFVCLMGQELVEGTPAAEAVPKMVANVAGCVPEVLAIEDTPPPQQLVVEGVSWAVWFVISAVRYGIQMEREVRAVFDPR